MADAGEERAPRRPGKAGRNEQRKLIATFLNNVAVGLSLASLLQPGLALIQHSRAVSLAEWVASAMLVAAAFLLAFGARFVVARLED